MAAQLPMDIVYFVYGLAFVVLGVRIFSDHHLLENQPLKAPLNLIGGFALLHGLSEWMEMWQLLKGGPPWLADASLALMTASYCLLLGFPAGLLAQFRHKARWVGRLALSLTLWALISPLVLFIAVNGWSDHPDAPFGVLVRYFIAVPAAIGSGAALFLYGRFHASISPNPGYARRLKAAGITFFAYAFLAGIIVPPTDLPPSNHINSDAFLAVVGWPVELFRAGFALILALLLGQALGVFLVSSRLALQEAAHTAAESLRESRAARTSLEKELALRSQAEERLPRHDWNYRQLYEGSRDGWLRVDMQGRILECNRAYREMLGHTEAGLKKLAHSDLTPDCWHEADASAAEQILSLGYSDVYEKEYLHREGRRFPVEIQGFALQDQQGETVGMWACVRDISERRGSDARLNLAAQVIDSTPVSILVTDADGVIQSVNPAFCHTTGYAADEVLGLTPRVLSSGCHDAHFYRSMWSNIDTLGFWQGEIWNRRKNGEIYPEWINISAIKDDDGNISNYVGIFSDISAQEHIQKRLHELVYYDALTGLPNRQLFNERMQAALSQAQRHEKRVALLFLDLDRFKHVNDSLGHRLGDQLLCDFSGRLSRSFRQTDVVARLGGDEFTVLLSDIERSDQAAALVLKLQRALREPFMLDSHELYVTSSVGICLYPDDATDADTLLRNADTAMYRAKEKGHGSYCFYSSDLTERYQQRLSVEQELRKAIELDQLCLHYQPQFDVLSGRVDGFEALIRWQHPEKGMLSPDKFLPIAEESGLITDIGAWVLREACHQAAQWRRAGDQDIHIAVNVSVRQMMDPSFAVSVVDALMFSDLPPELLELEITESLLLEEPQRAADVLQSLRDLGIQFAIDDFGTGYSSLGYLKLLPLDYLKLDRMFVKNIGGEEDDSGLILAAIAMARNLKLEIVAEGVETPEQAEFLTEHGCDRLQGWLIGRPMPAVETFTLLEEENQRAASTKNEGANLL